MTKMQWRRCQWRVSGPYGHHDCDRPAYWQEAGTWFCRSHWAMVQKRIEQS